MNPTHSKLQSLKAILQPPMINLNTPKDRFSQSHFASKSLMTATERVKPSPTHFDITLPNFPLSPKPMTSPIRSGEDNHLSYKSIRLIKRISSFAKNASKDFETKVKIINHIEKRKIHAIQEDKPVVIPHPNSPTFQTSSVHPSIGDIFAPCSALVFKEEISLLEKKKIPLLVEHHRFVYFQIDCARFPTPLVINIYKGSETPASSKLKVYVSKTNKKPSALSCDYSVESRNVKIFEKDYKSNFETPAYYFGIYSESRFEGSITYLFGEEGSRAKHVKSQSVYISPRLKWKLRTPEDPVTIEEIKEIQKEKMIKRWNLSNGRNNIEINKHPLTPKEREHTSEQKRRIFENRINQVLLNKKLRDEERLQKKLFMIGKHDLVRTIKGFSDDYKDKMLSKQTLQKDWLTTLTFFPMIHNLKEFFNSKKIAYKKRQKIYLKFHYFFIKYRRNNQKKGTTMTDRFVFDIRGSLECYARMLLNTKQNVYNRIVGAFFKDFLISSNIAKNLLQTRRKIPLVFRVRERWLKFKNKAKRFRKLFSLIWDKYNLSILTKDFASSPAKLHPATMRTVERKPTFTEKSATEKILADKNIADKKSVQVSSAKGQQDDKRAKFVKYMMELSHLRYDIALDKYRDKIENLNLASRKIAYYASFFILDEEALIKKNAWLSKSENLKYDEVDIRDLNLGNAAFESYYKKYFIRPPRLFYVPKMEEISKAIINVANGDLEIKLVTSLSDVDC